MDQVAVQLFRTFTIPALAVAFRLTMFPTSFRGPRFTSYLPAQARGGFAVAQHRGFSAIGKPISSCRHEQDRCSTCRLQETSQTYEEMLRTLRAITCGQTCLQIRSSLEQLPLTRIRTVRRLSRRAAVQQTRFELSRAGSTRVPLVFRITLAPLVVSEGTFSVDELCSIRTSLCSRAFRCAKI